MQKQTLIEKAGKVEEIKNLIQKYKVIGIASLHKVRAAQLQELKKKFEKEVYLRVVKNNLMERALSRCKGKPDMERLREYLKGSNILLFTKLNPFKLSLLLEKNKVEMIAKAGDVAAHDIIVPAGNTGTSPGPIISQLNSVGLPTRIESGSVWIGRDTLVAKKGEVISERLAAVLSKLGIKSVEAGLDLKVIYDDGLIIPKEQLHIDLEEFKQTIGEAYAYAMNLSLNVAYPTTENISTLIQAAHQEAFNLGVNANITTPDLIVDLLRKAHTEAFLLSSKIGLQA